MAVLHRFYCSIQTNLLNYSDYLQTLSFAYDINSYDFSDANSKGADQYVRMRMLFSPICCSRTPKHVFSGPSWKALSPEIYNVHVPTLKQCFIYVTVVFLLCNLTRVKSGKFGRSAKFGQRPCLFHILIIGIKIN